MSEVSNNACACGNVGRSALDSLKHNLARLCDGWPFNALL